MIPLAQVGEMDELQTVFYLALIVGLLVIFAVAFIAIGLRQWVSLLRDGEHPVIASVVGVTLIGALGFMVVTASIIVHAIVVQRGCLRC